MSSGPRYPTHLLRPVADWLVRALSRVFEEGPYVAGSLRRRTRDAADIELVGQPTSVRAVETRLSALGLPLQPGSVDRQIQLLVQTRALPSPVPMTLHLARRYLHRGQPSLFELPCPVGPPPSNLGYKLLLATGSARFNHLFVTSWAQGGLRPESLVCRDGFVWPATSGPAAPLIAPALPNDKPDETALFRLWGLDEICLARYGQPTVPPELRTAAVAQGLRQARLENGA